MVKASREGDGASLASSVADRLVESYAAATPLAVTSGHELPSPPEVAAVLTELRELLFPGYAGERRPAGAALKAQVEARLADVRVRLIEQIFRGLHHRCRGAGADCQGCADAAARITD